MGRRSQDRSWDLLSVDVWKLLSYGQNIVTVFFGFSGILAFEKYDFSADAMRNRKYLHGRDF
ncbi:unnamed protein product [Acanthoscelides obtectus]|uniref:Uncharacterized protein n=1 Tax=Acanthoscelides obtectus TaxID=200917 RepID=A0A9P0P803_ACAOB|nr:unnamed protein product [Acanthoscelides obtectus]CAK1680033.1 hypothetical protein AOBTE_LOCUS32497 [Acanthoscelides obtectus]